MLLQVQSRDGERVTWWTFTLNWWAFLCRRLATTEYMSCIIGHANPTTGRCQVKQRLIAAETGYCVKTVRRAVDWWVAHGFLIEQDMGLAKSRAYHLQWNLFEMHWISIAEDIKA